MHIEWIIVQSPDEFQIERDTERGLNTFNEVEKPMTDVYHICREPVRADRSQLNVEDKFRARMYGWWLPPPSRELKWELIMWELNGTKIRPRYRRQQGCHERKGAIGALEDYGERMHVAAESPGQTSTSLQSQKRKTARGSADLADDDVERVSRRVPFLYLYLRIDRYPRNEKIDKNSASWTIVTSELFVGTEQTRWPCREWFRASSSYCPILRRRFGKPRWTHWRTSTGTLARDCASTCKESIMCRKPSKWNGQGESGSLSLPASPSIYAEFSGILSDHQRDHPCICSRHVRLSWCQPTRSWIEPVNGKPRHCANLIFSLCLQNAPVDREVRSTKGRRRSPALGDVVRRWVDRSRIFSMSPSNFKLAQRGKMIRNAPHTCYPRPCIVVLVASCCHRAAIKPIT